LPHRRAELVDVVGYTGLTRQLTEAALGRLDLSAPDRGGG
jgi:hypothetical protein